MGALFGKEEFLNLDTALKREWLETNNLGGYASSTICGVHTRKYHGWFSSQLKNLGGKYLLLSKVGATLEFNNNEIYELDTNKYPAVFQPHGHDSIHLFDSDIVPSTYYHIKERALILEQSLMLVYKKNILLVHYKLQNYNKGIKEKNNINKNIKAHLKLYPLLAYRGIHALTKSNNDLNVRSYFDDNSINRKNKIVKISPYHGMPDLFIDSDKKLSYYPSPIWHYNIEYIEEKNRGFDHREDLFRPGIFEIDMNIGDCLLISFSLEKPKEYGKTSLQDIWIDEINRRLALRKYLTEKTKVNIKPKKLLKSIVDLKISAQQFIVEHENGNSSIVAGYPWFGEWGRDTMISIPGIAIHSADSNNAFKILECYAKYIKNGVIPNYLPEKDGHSPAYNSVDASLWFFYAVQEYINHTSDYNGVKTKLKKAMDEIINAYLQNRNPLANLKDNGLIWAGDKNTQLTWMDARVNDLPVTPRYGFAVEINALWYNALSFYQEFDSALAVKQLINKINDSFINVFYNKQYDFLADVVNENGQDLSLRPNQIFAVSLQYSPVQSNKPLVKSIVRAVRDKLLTPYGLRTLSPDDVRFCSRYEGNSEKRDGAYHQGTVWPWMSYHFAQAYLKVADNKKKATNYLYNHFKLLVTASLKEHGINSVAEIFDGNIPYRANGCPFQAWSVAEVIRTYELLSIYKRKYE
ncbi:MAG: glycogen debranching enzyme family protein [Oligoflexia bacterium]|nr:glycogen debranching enzyme family protein [Oligoflexia bacterium]